MKFSDGKQRGSASHDGHPYGDRVIGVVLTGQLDDGTAGLWDIKRLGGIAVVQNPEEAAFPSARSPAP